MKKSKLFFDILRLPIDFIAIFSALLLAYKVRPVTDLIPGVQYYFLPEYIPPFSDYLQFSVAATFFLILLFSLNAIYSIKFAEGFGKTVLKIFFLISVWLMFIIAYYFLIVHELFFSRVALIQIWLFSIVFVILGRIIILIIKNYLYRFGVGRIRLLFIGVNSFSDHTYHALSQDRKYKIIGALAPKMESRKQGALKIIGTLDDLESIVKTYHIDEIIQTEIDLPHMPPDKLLSFCRAHHLHYYFVPEVLQLQTLNVGMEVIDGIPLISLKQTRLEGWGRVYKRVFDFFFSLCALSILIPFFFFIGILIKLDSRGPVFYKSRRKYRDEVFNLYKFRSMTVDAEKKRAELLAQNERTGPLFKIKNDPRVTKLGRFLRKTSIDELPQLFNVLIGNMSLVGPRPHLPEEVEQYEAHHLGVFAIKPGITGLAQINGRSNLNFEDEIKLDFYYIENWSLWLDLKIIFRSVGIMFKADGH